MPERRDLFAFVLALLRDPSLAADALRRIPPGSESFSAAREAAVAVSRRRKRPIPLSPAAIEALERAASGPQQVQVGSLRGSLDRMGRSDRSLLRMRYREGRGLERIARRVKNTVTKTQKALHRARMALAKAVQDP